MRILGYITQFGEKGQTEQSSIKAQTSVSSVQTAAGSVIPKWRVFYYPPQKANLLFLASVIRHGAKVISDAKELCVSRRIGVHGLHTVNFR